MEDDDSIVRDGVARHRNTLSADLRTMFNNEDELSGIREVAGNTLRDRGEVP